MYVTIRNLLGLFLTSMLVSVSRALSGDHADFVQGQQGERAASSGLLDFHIYKREFYSFLHGVWHIDILDSQKIFQSIFSLQSV